MKYDTTKSGKTYTQIGKVTISSRKLTRGNVLAARSHGRLEGKDITHQDRHGTPQLITSSQNSRKPV